MGVSVKNHRTFEFLSNFLEFFGDFLEFLGQIVEFWIKSIEFSVKIYVYQRKVFIKRIFIKKFLLITKSIYLSSMTDYKDQTYKLVLFMEKIFQGIKEMM